MKSFYKFLNSRLEFGETLDVNRKPIFRSSAIFPVIQNNFYTTNITFLGYWLIKRNINEVTVLVTLRTEEGEIIKRQSILVNQPKSYLIELNSLLKETNLQSEFLGSIELEIFSTQDMVFPYPALVLNYYGKNFNTCVHTVGRIYNDFEDLRENEASRVPETGFDIHSTEDLEPFISFVNGPIPNSNASFRYVITNSESKKFQGKFEFGKIEPYETVMLKFKEKIPELNKILNNKPGTITLEHNLEGFFPRFIAGNIQNSLHSISFTHTFYDCSSCAEESDYWNRSNENYYDCSVYVPIFIDNEQFTELMIYPNFSPSDFDLHITLHDSTGTELQKIDSFLQVSSKDSKLLKVDFKKLIESLGIDKDKVRSAHLISDFKNKIPARLKFGLNVGVKNSKSNLPCNICFNSKVGNPFVENKPGSFHWSPFFNHANGVVTIANFSPKKNYSKPANVTLKFYNDDSLVLEDKIILPANSEYRLYSTDSKFENLPKNEPTWVTIEADNPNIQGFYFNFHNSGAVAGDHFF